MKYLHTMVRITDIESSLEFYCEKLGLKEIKRKENKEGRFTLIFLAAPGDEEAQLELTYNWDSEVYSEGRNFGHLAYQVEDIYETCKGLMEAGILIKHDFKAGKARYEINDNHNHLIDVNSGEIVEFVDKDIEKLQNEVARKLGYKLVDHKLELYGSKIKK